VKEKILPFRRYCGPLSPSGWGPKGQSVTQITYDAALCAYVSDDEMHPWNKERRYDLDYRPHGRPALRHFRHAACDVVDVHSGVRREPRADQGTPAAITRPARY